MKVVAIIQARMGSTRLPGKMMKSILGKPVIEYVFDRVRPSRLLDEVWLATTTEPEDETLVAWAELNNIPYFRGSVNDVLDRYYETARLAKADVVVRITGDCPLADYKVIDEVVGQYLSNYPAFDYVCNTQPPTFPDGLDVEVFSFKALEKAWKEAQLTSEREHVTPYIWKHPELFKIKNIRNDIDLSALRWTLDTPEDLTLINLVLTEVQKEKMYVHFERILEIFSQHPEWNLINAHYKRNEGYIKSLKEDDKI